jgi:hypothetical protein
MTESSHADPVSEGIDLELVAEVAIQMAAGGLTGGMAGAAVSAAVPLLIRTMHLMRDRTRQATEQACAASGLTPLDLLYLILDDERLLTIAQNVFEAAHRSSLESVRRALGKTLGQACRDDAVVDESEMIARALSAIAEPHVRALGVLRQYALEEWNGSADFTLSQATLMRRTLLLRRFPGLRYVDGPVLAGLEELGLVVPGRIEIPAQLDGKATEEAGWRLTEFGERLLDYLLDAPGYAESVIGGATSDEKTRWTVEHRNEGLTVGLDVRDFELPVGRRNQGVFHALGRKDPIVVADEAEVPGLGWFDVDVRPPEVWTLLSEKASARASVLLRMPEALPRPVIMTGVKPVVVAPDKDSNPCTVYARFFFADLSK